MVIAVNLWMNQPGGHAQPDSRITSVNVCQRRDACVPGSQKRMPPGIAPLVRSAYAHN